MMMEPEELVYGVTAESLRETLAKVLPRMDQQQVTMNNLYDRLSALLCVPKTAVKQYKALIKEYVMTGEWQHHQQEQVEEQEPPNSKEEEDEEEKEAPVQRRVAQSSRKRKNVVAEESEEDDDEEEEEQYKEEEDDEEEEEFSPRQHNVALARVNKKAPSKTQPTPTPTPTRKRRQDDGEEKEVTAKQPTKRAKRSNTRVDSEGLLALKEMARAACLMGPAVYRQLKQCTDPEDEEEVVRERLASAGITFTGRYPKKQEIAAVRKRKALEKELDGIDTSAIITGTRRRRSAAALTSTDEYEQDGDEENGAHKETKEGNTKAFKGDHKQEGEEEDEEEHPSDSSSEASFHLDDDDEDE